MNKLRILLIPISLLYGFAVWMRNKLFDWKLLKSTSFKIPLISVGNITVGGTGKTPHVEYLIELLKETLNVAVLSRGYRRKTKGFVLAGKKASPATIGDEPYQIYRKFDKVDVAVCESRVEGVNKLLNKRRKINAVLLDDAFQHRYIQPGLSILLIDFNRPVFSDYLLPAGNLREGLAARKRAHIIIVSKAPEELSETTKRFWEHQIKLLPGQYLFFTTFRYGKPKTISGNKPEYNDISQLKDKKVSVLLVTGIANPAPMLNYLGESGTKFTAMHFSDHHNFTSADIRKIKTAFKKLKGKRKILLTTEKDAVRFQHLDNFPKSLKNNAYYLPIKIAFLDGMTEKFNRMILDYAGKN